MLHVVAWLAVGTMCCLLVQVDSRIPDIFYPFGPEDLNNDLSDVDVDIPICGVHSTKFTVDLWGVLWATDPVHPVNEFDISIFNAYIADELVSSGRLYGRRTTDTDLLTRARNNIAARCGEHCIKNFQPQYLLIATWANVTYRGGNDNTPKNSFQIVLATDSAEYTFVIFNYDNLTWSGREGNMTALVAVNCGYGNYVEVPSSRTNDVISLGTRSNIVTPGQWVYRVDGTNNFECQDDCVPDTFFPFGVAYGDIAAPPSDDDFITVNADYSVPYCGQLFTSIHVGTNGYMLFDSHVSDAAPNLIAVYHSDVDTTVNNGRLYYRQTADPSLLSRASDVVSANCANECLKNFRARWLLISTWRHVTYYGGSSNTATNSFQAVLATDWIHSFVILNYGTMRWTYATVKVGIYCQDGSTNTFSHGLADITSGTNAGVSGRWMSLLDGDTGFDCNTLNIPDNALCVPDTFFPFGASNGDTVPPPADDAEYDVLFGKNFTYCNKSFAQAQVSTNGKISFGSGYAMECIDVYSCDLDPSASNASVSFRTTNDSVLLSSASSAIRAASTYDCPSDFQARWLFIVTWYSVTFYGGSPNTPTSTFQAVLATDWSQSFVILNYGNIASVRLYEAVGISCRDGLIAYMNRSQIVDSISDTTQKGQWIFRVDGISGSGCMAPLTPGLSTDNRLPGNFFPFGADSGDIDASFGGNGVISMDISSGMNLPFCGKVFSRLYVGRSGYISFNGPATWSGPVQYVINLFGDHSADVESLVYASHISFRNTTDALLLKRATMEISSMCSANCFGNFRARWLFIATWTNVTIIGGQTNRRSHSFQVVLATDWMNSFAILNYENLTWAYGIDASVASPVGISCSQGVNGVDSGTRRDATTGQSWVFHVDRNDHFDCNSTTIPGILNDKCVPDTFFPFGEAENDTVTSSDNATVEIPRSMPYCGTTSRNLNVARNGFIVFDGIEPGANSVIDVYHTERIASGRVSYRETEDSELLRRSSSVVSASCAKDCLKNFQASWLFIATWHNVTFAGEKSNSQPHSFQAVLATDWIRSFIILNYGSMIWNVAAQVGISCRGSSVNKTFSYTDITNIGLRSNVATMGRWMFLLDGARQFDCNSPELCVRDTMFPFGVAYGDTVASLGARSYRSLAINYKLPYCGKLFTTMHVGTDGYISFDATVPQPATLLNASNLIAVYHSTRVNNGSLYYRQTSDPQLLSRASAVVSASCANRCLKNFRARWLLIATWNDVTYSGGSSNLPTNSFQAVLATDWTRSFIILNYGNMTLNDSVQVGVSCRDGPINKILLPKDVGSGTNIGRTGQWTFFLDGASQFDCNLSTTIPDNNLCVPDTFLAFGAGSGDIVPPPFDDTQYIALLDNNFIYCNNSFDQAYVSPNGMLSFERTYVKKYTINVYPYDLDPRINNGTVSYRTTVDSQSLSKASTAIRAAYYAGDSSSDFQARWLFIATWYNVAFYGGSPNTPTSTFQAVLATDWNQSYVILNYGNVASTPPYVLTPVTNDSTIGISCGDGWIARMSQSQIMGSIANTTQRGQWIFHVGSISGSNRSASTTQADNSLPVNFFRAGVDYGDTIVSFDAYNGSYVDVTSGIDLPFCGETFSRLYVGKSGYISFSGPVNWLGSLSYVINLFGEHSSAVESHAFTSQGRVSFRSTTDASFLNRATALISTTFSTNCFRNFRAKWLFIATWYNATITSGQTTRRTHSFQVVLATDWMYSFAVFNYENMTWAYGTDANVVAPVGIYCGEGANGQHAFGSKYNVDTQDATKGQSLLYHIDRSEQFDCSSTAIAGILNDTCVPGTFFPFGGAQGDTILSSDSETVRFLYNSMPYCGNTFQKLRVSKHGFISFDDDATPNPGQVLTNPANLIDIYRQRVDTSVANGRVYYRTTDDAGLRQRASCVIATACANKCLKNFQASSLFIATWHNVTFVGENSTNMPHSFQAVLATDWIRSFIILNYGNMMWNGNAQVGVYCRQPQFNKTLSSNEISSISLRSNVGTKGRWMFYLDGTSRFDCNATTIPGILTDACVPDTFFSFGEIEKDSNLPLNVDTGNVTIPYSLPYCGSTFRQLEVGRRGFIVFSEYSPNGDGVPGNIDLIDVYRTKGVANGRVYYRTTDDLVLRRRVSSVIATACTSEHLKDFQASWLFIATWYNMTFVGDNPNSPLHSFQAVLATDWTHSFVVLNYGNMMWDGTAQVGVYCRQPLSRRTLSSSTISGINLQSNVGTQGRWMFYLDGENQFDCNVSNVSDTSLSPTADVTLTTGNTGTGTSATPKIAPLTGSAEGTGTSAIPKIAPLSSSSKASVIAPAVIIPIVVVLVVIGVVCIMWLRKQRTLEISSQMTDDQPSGLSNDYVELHNATDDDK